MSLPMLSKSRFLAGLQCPLRLWRQCYNPELASGTSRAQQAIFHMGHEVGRMATRLYPDGVLVVEDHLRHGEAVNSTIAAMNDPSVSAIFEAAFVHDSVRVRVDVLERFNSNTWNLVEVKSSTSVKEIHQPDVAVQYYVLRGAGLDVHKAGILHLNNLYLYDGHDLDLQQLFVFSDITDEVIALQEEIAVWLAGLKQMLSTESSPAIQPSRHCQNPYLCEFWEHCTAEMPEFWVVNLCGITRHKLNQLAPLGVQDIRRIPVSFPLTPLQERIRTCAQNREEYLDPELAHQLKDVEHPIHFLDFETAAPAIPHYAGTRPYQTIPFQWSDHIQYEHGSIEHRQYLCQEDKDPREDFVATLLETIGEKGTIFVYSNYEKRILSELADHLPPRHGRLTNAKHRFKDLHALIKRHYYHPEFHGSFSLKSVLPVLVPDMTYDNLAIQEGTLASYEYLRMLDPATPVEERERIRHDLLAYCGHDTLGLVRIREELLKRF